MLTRRSLTKAFGLATAACGCGVPLGFMAQAVAQDAPAPAARGVVLIKNAAVISMDPKIGVLPRADVLVRNGVIEAVAENLSAPGAEIIDAQDMIVTPGFVDTHYHMWSALGRNYLADGFEYFPAKAATAAKFTADDFYASIMLAMAELANNGVTTVHNWAHNVRSPAHADAELRAHRDSRLRARYSYGHIDGLARDRPLDFADIERVRAEWFGAKAPFEGLVHLGVNLRGVGQATEEIFHRDVAAAKERKLAISVHAGQTPPNRMSAADYEKRGYLGPDFLICHYLPGSDEDYAAIARAGSPLSFATHSEMRLGLAGDARDAMMRMRKSGVSISLSSDATSIAPPNMLENMRFAWNMAIPWRGTPTEKDAPMGFSEVLAMGTINGAKALGLGDVVGSITPGKRADLVLIRTNDVNTAPMGNIEATVVMSATPQNVDTVLVDGRFVKRDGKLVGYDVPRIVAAAKEASLRIRKEAGGRLAPPACCGG
ncbi:MAG TPA: amidohydrolase family protein [Beijerinckiaceae bacterium]|jgi:cytosine/adenosine deaminase-related metal-dependent hydrolase